MTPASERQVRTPRAPGDETFLAVVGLVVFVARVGIPSVGLPFLAVGEVLLIKGSDQRRSEEDFVGLHDVGRTRYWHRPLDFAHNGVDGGVTAQCLLDDVMQQRQLAYVRILQRRELAVLC